MKSYREYIVFALLMTSISAFCQFEATGVNYKKTLVDGREWLMLKRNLDPDYDSYYVRRQNHITLSVSGDTIVNEIPCKKLSGDFYFAGYEKEGRVLGFQPFDGDSIVEFELFSFAHQLGDKVIKTFIDEPSYYGEVIKVDSIDVAGEKRKRIVVYSKSITDSLSYSIIVEGIGVNNELHYRLLAPSDGSYYELVAVYDNGECIITKADFWKGINLSAVVDIVDSARQDNKCYDIFGRAVAEPVNGQLLIKNGNKFIHRE